MICANKVWYAHPGADHHALHDISFAIGKGQSALLCGSNGAGKSTLLKLLSGIIKPCKGQLRCAGVRYPGRSARPRKCALIMQEADHQILGGTVEEDLLICWSNPSQMHRDRAKRLAQEFGLNMHADVSTLSYGQKRKLCIASALITDPLVMLMDEPGNGLDYAGCLLLSQCIKKLRTEGISFVIATHDPSVFMGAFENDDRFMVLKNGLLAADIPLLNAMREVSAHPEWGIRPWEK